LPSARTCRFRIGPVRRAARLTYAFLPMAKFPAAFLGNRTAHCVAGPTRLPSHRAGKVSPGVGEVTADRILYAGRHQRVCDCPPRHRRTDCREREETDRKAEGKETSLARPLPLLAGSGIDETAAEKIQ